MRSVADNLVQIHHLETIPLFMISNCNFNPIPNRIETFCNSSSSASDFKNDKTVCEYPFSNACVIAGTRYAK